MIENNQELRSLILRCVELQKQVAKDVFIPEPKALEYVSEKALDQTKDVSDVRTDLTLSNCLVFHTNKLPGTVLDNDIIALRKEIDEIVIEYLNSKYGKDSNPVCSGHFWYPPQSYMKWHTNSRKPGWRFYINYAEEPGKSFFRYRDPESEKVVTSWDQIWNYRHFHIQKDSLFWHAIHSNTNRFSFGYLMSP